MTDTFKADRTQNYSPAIGAFAITAGSSALTRVTRGIYVGTAGDVQVTMLDDGSNVVFSSVPAGTILPIRATHVLSGSTTASDIVGLY